ncbi:MAG: nucleotide exchange factor GrpE [Xanthomonadales bacterium]|jgi:molecular chaperone GrpE|nr:nucleotide exchange factor GrpE [Xanthomonadales bacterium]
MSEKKEKPDEQAEAPQAGQPENLPAEEEQPAGKEEILKKSFEELESEAIDAAREEVARMRDAMLRMQAETENTRKRLTRELERSRRMALEQVMKDLLQVRDSMERGLEIDRENATVQALVEGQELTLKMLNKVMQDHHLEVIDPAGEPFDPELHEAMTVLPSAEHEENTVMDVIQKGFRLHDRLIRPARVVVTRKP